MASYLSLDMQCMKRTSETKSQGCYFNEERRILFSSLFARMAELRVEKA